jgi:hypothetical protein
MYTDIGDWNHVDTPKEENTPQPLCAAASDIGVPRLFWFSCFPRELRHLFQ